MSVKPKPRTTAVKHEDGPGTLDFVYFFLYESPQNKSLLRCPMGWWRGRIHQVPVNKDDPLWEQALDWQKNLPNYTFDPSALAKIEAESKEKILKYLEYYDSEVKGTKHVKYLRPEDGVPVN